MWNMIKAFFAGNSLWIVAAVIGALVSGFLWIRADAYNDGVMAERANGEVHTKELQIQKLTFERDAAERAAADAAKDEAEAARLAAERQDIIDGYQSDITLGVSTACLPDVSYDSRMRSITIGPK